MTVADIVTANGVVHVIDAVLLPEVFPKSVAEVVINSDDHETLETAVIAADLAETLSGEGPFTLFAPTDDAFGMVDPDALADLLADPEGALSDVLLYHALGDVVTSGELSDGMMATTLQTEEITVSITDGNVFINGAQVTVADIVTANGVVHVINMVLLPPSTVSVEENSIETLNIYPNPVSNGFVQLGDKNLNGELALISDTFGRLVASENVVNDRINLQDLATGIYFITIHNDLKTFTARLVVE